MVINRFVHWPLFIFLIKQTNYTPQTRFHHPVYTDITQLITISTARICANIEYESSFYPHKDSVQLLVLIVIRIISLRQLLSCR